MKYVFTSLLLLVAALSIPARAQISCIGNDPTATAIDTFQVTVGLGKQPGSGDGSNRTSGASVALTVFVERTSSGHIRYSLLASSVQFSGDPEIIDSYSTRDIFRLAEQAAIAQGIIKGYTPCTTDCRAVTVKVCQNACVSRVGHGTETRFEVCDPMACCTRTYQVCCPDGPNSPVTKLIGVEGATCAPTGPGVTSCESICW